MAGLNLSIGFMLFSGVDALKPALEAAKRVGIKEIDTAEMYGEGRNESDLGDVGAASLGFSISTKNLGGWNKGVSLKPDNLRKATKESLGRLKVDQVDILYIHGPDRILKLSDWVPTIQELYKQGVFRRFGVSNFSPKEVRELYDYSKSNGYVLPTVYQGNYSPIARSIETDLFPVLRELGIAFYAYSPLAGGFLTKSRKALEEHREGGRFSTSGESLNKLYRGMYMKPSLLDALDKWEALTLQQGVSKAELAYRWVYYHSAINPALGDFVILGASKIEQIESTVEGLKKGPLEPDVARGINEIWDLVKHEAVVDNFDATQT